MGDESEQKEEKKDTLNRDALKNGPAEDRGCTDIICCLIFIAFLVGMVGVGSYGWTQGDPRLLMTLWNSDGLGCGLNTTVKDYPYLYYPTIDFAAAQKAEPKLTDIKELLKYGVCVKKCPGNDTTVAVECYKSKYMTTQSTYYKDCTFFMGGVSKNVPFRYNTTVFGGKICAPSGEALKQTAIKTFKEKVWDVYVTQTGLGAYLTDIMATKHVLAITLATAFFVGFIYLIVLRYIGGPMIYLSILGLIIGSVMGSYMLFQQSKVILDAKQQEYYKWGSYVGFGFSALLVCCVICNFKNIRIGIAVMKCTAEFIGGTPQVFLAPPIAIVIIIAWLCFWIMMALYIVSVGQVEPRKDLPFLTHMKWNDMTRYAFLYSLFGYLWMNAFIIGVCQFVISAACAIWYFTSTSDSNGSGSLSKGFYWVFRYHLGSIAFGSFLIAVVQMIRIIFEYYADQIEKANKENPAIKIILCATRYLLDCLERFIKFISKNGYIQMAITGDNFCKSAWNAFCLILKNALRFGTANSIGFIFNVLGVGFIMMINCLILYILLHYVPAYKGLANNWIGPVVVAGLEGFIIGVMFMSVFSFASDTILQAFLVDEELNRPDGTRPAIMNDFIEGASDAVEKKKANEVE